MGGGEDRRFPIRVDFFAMFWKNKLKFFGIFNLNLRATFVTLKVSAFSKIAKKYFIAKGEIKRITLDRSL